MTRRRMVRCGAESTCGEGRFGPDAKDYADLRQAERGAEKNPDNQIESARLSPWSRVWEERGEDYPEDDPVGLDGFDHGAGKLRRQQVTYILTRVRRALCLGSKTRLLEVGCGAGMLLGPLSTTVALAIGCDLAESMVRRARHLFIGLKVNVAEAIALPYPAGAFDTVLVHSVFHYFPSHEYARFVLGELCRVCRPGGRVWISDIPDVAKREASRQFREKEAALDRPRWHSSVTGSLEHRYYDHTFFSTFCEDAGCGCEVTARDVPEYMNASFRFNVLITLPRG